MSQGEVILYQFAVSHYCEKIRWALDFKNINYRAENLLPGFHRSKTRAIAKYTNVPILQHQGRVIQNSSDIINYLDMNFAKNPLTPRDAENQKAALIWEYELDKELGPHVRRFCYQILIDNPRALINLLSAQGPWYGKLLYRAVYPRVRDTLRQSLQMDQNSKSVSLKVIERYIDRLSQAYEKGPYLVANQFSRADLTAASLFAPLFTPTQYGLKWPKSLPYQLQETMAKMRPSLSWAVHLYEKHRQRDNSILS